MRTLGATWPAHGLTRRALIAIHLLSSESFFVRVLDHIEGHYREFSGNFIKYRKHFCYKKFMYIGLSV